MSEIVHLPTDQPEDALDESSLCGAEGRTTVWGDQVTCGDCDLFHSAAVEGAGHPCEFRNCHNEV